MAAKARRIPEGAVMTDMHREGFESWMKGEGYCTERYFGQYTPGIEKRWEGWQAAMRYRDEQEKQA